MSVNRHGERDEPKELCDGTLYGGLHTRNLTCLHVSARGLELLIKPYGTWGSLSSLDLTDNDLKDLPEELSRLPVNRITVAGNQFRYLPSCFFLGLGDVRDLDISRNRISSLSTPPLCAAKLRSLDLSDNRLISLPEWLSNSCGSLWSLSAAGNANLRAVGGGAALRPPLRRLDLSACSVSELDFVAALPLTALRLGNFRPVSAKIGNCFWDFPKIILRAAETLSELSLRGTGLSELPPCVGELRLLALLDLRDCKLQTLPQELGQLGSLHTLLLSRNSLVSLPDSMGDLQSLRCLRVDANQVDVLPEGLGQLSGLELLDLYDNRLNQWQSSWLLEMTSLKAFDLERNHCESQDSERYLELRRCLRLDLGSESRSNGCRPNEEEPFSTEETWLEWKHGPDYPDHSDDLSDDHLSDDHRPILQQKSESDWSVDDSSDDEWSPENRKVRLPQTVRLIGPTPIGKQMTFVKPNCCIEEGQFAGLTEH